MRNIIKTIPLAIVAAVLVGCAAPKYDYTTFLAHQPRSIAVLPPINESTAVEGTYGYLTTVTRPLAEKGYYVFPVAVVDNLMKENGLPGAPEMHQAPLHKLREILGTDAVLYIILKKYGTKYIVISSMTTVAVDAKLVDTKTGKTIWEGSATVAQNTAGTGNPIGDLIAAAVDQIIKTVVDHAHSVSAMTNDQLVNMQGRGLLYGPHHPKFGTDLPK
ncbi:MAG: hypothetical protein ACJASX_001474 [Limisphaerales bacterium]|jgi:hypothetical protein